MVATRLKVFVIWGGLLFIVIQVAVSVLMLAFGQTTGLILTIPVIILAACFAGYKAALSLKDKPGYERKNMLTVVGAGVAIFAALFATGFNYFLTGQFSFGAGFLTIVAAAIGGYLVERKKK